jgi:hypothetical protein
MSTRNEVTKTNMDKIMSQTLMLMEIAQMCMDTNDIQLANTSIQMAQCVATVATLQLLLEVNKDAIPA